MFHQGPPLEGDKTAGAAHDQGWRQQGGQQGGRRDRRQGISQVEENVRKTILKRTSSSLSLQASQFVEEGNTPSPNLQINQRWWNKGMPHTNKKIY